MQDFAEDLRKLFAEADGLDMKPLFQPGVDPQAAAASMASDAGINNLLLQVCMYAGPCLGYLARFNVLSKPMYATCA